MNNGQNFFVYRPLSPESSDRVKKVQELYTSVESFNPIDDLHMTLLGRYVIPKTPISRLLPLMEQGPSTSERPYTMDVIESRIVYRTRKLGRSSIQLILDNDTNDMYQAEHAHFRKEAEKFGSTLSYRVNYPHVTIGYLDTANAISTILDPTEEIVGEKLVFMPIESEHGSIQAAKIPGKKKERLWHKLSKEERLLMYPHSTQEPEMKVRTLSNRKIPSGLLSTIRTSSLEQ
jgi:hypothetical protein